MIRTRHWGGQEGALPPGLAASPRRYFSQQRGKGLGWLIAKARS